MKIISSICFAIAIAVLVVTLAALINLGINIDTQKNSFSISAKWSLDQISTKNSVKGANNASLCNID